jgi:protein-disulfide isomerase
MTKSILYAATALSLLLGQACAEKPMEDTQKEASPSIQTVPLAADTAPQNSGQQEAQKSTAETTPLIDTPGTTTIQGSTGQPQETGQRPGLSQAAKELIGQTAVDYLKSHPEAFAEIFANVQEHNKKEMEKVAQEQVIKNKDKLFDTADGTPILGNPKGTTEVVVFMDPFCGHCRSFKDTLLEAIKTDPTLKIIARDLALMSPKSSLVAKALLAAARQGKYSEMEKAMYTVEPTVTAEEITAKANGVGLKIDQFQKDMKSKEVENALNSNMALAREISLTGTPTTIVKSNNKVLAGAISLETLRNNLKS